jgi:predicted transcriptional regulator
VLEQDHGVRVQVSKLRADRAALRRFDPGARTLTLSETLAPRSRNFQLAHQLGLLSRSEVLTRLADAQGVSGDETRRLLRVALASYFAGAALMPYGPFLAAARADRYDVELIGHRFQTSFEQVCHRLTCLRRPGSEGVPFHFIRIDIAGNISKRFSASGIRFARFAGACPRWNVHSAFLTPGMIRTQLSRMPDGTSYFCFARTVSKGGGGYHAPHTVQAIGMGCEVRHARELVYADGIDLENLDAAVPIGVTCRLCERMDCEQRAFPPLQYPLHVDENVRGVSFYAPVGAEPSRPPRPAPRAGRRRRPGPDSSGGAPE